MACGIVKWFDNRRGYGFITQSSGVEVFVHYSAILGNNGEYRTLDDGEEVFFEVMPSERGLKALNVVRQNGNEQKRSSYPRFRQPHRYPQTQRAA